MKFTQFAKTTLAATILAATSLTLLTPAMAEVNVDQLIKQAEKAAYYAGDDGRSDARMMIVDSQGRKQLRQFTILRKDVEDNGDQKMMVFFSRPTDVKDTVFRVEKHADTNVDDDRWLYLPALDLVKRISAGDKRTSFVGSHFFYEDVSGRAVSQDDFSLVEENAERYVLKAVPKDPASVEFAYYIVEIDKATSLPVLINFYKSDDTNYRRVESVQVDDVQGFPTVLRSKVSDLSSGGYTLMEFRGSEYNVGLPDEVFTERSLRNPPVQWIK
ncbi:outer membrane lipoprotein-sorting protein [Alteromonas alba]|uniref:Outer membrane lipoprotein-sorting protein n=1 Tax=Alteromonas alba TaxID=2079529 RepID=A0A2S9VC47_9ALTE|nr:outer membrane lipoprotein-sorting protein [Alteromonas alba]PRO74006.1 outer membrane lipoprotein-sorting protein [Alteromonas alba]|tara:strand:- start:280 stop:1095 length:816 start_codon:yes stop_codon:yes gene_type:complete